MCVLHRSTSSTHPLTHPRQKARGSSVRICTYMAAFNKNTRRSRQSVRRCSANILFISADGFSVLARVVVPFFFLSSSLFFEKPKRQNPLHNRENHVTSYDESPSLRDISYDHSANNLYLRTPIYFLILAFPYTRPRCGVPFIVTM